jgi:glutamate-1-semialdehyde 2,1-aminomutase
MATMLDRTQTVAALRADVAARTGLSGQLWSAAHSLYPRGEISAARKFDPWPFYATRAEGAHIWDVDGNRYVDCCMCYGTLLLGHAPAPIVRAVRQQAADGLHFGAPHALEVAYARKLLACLPGMERIILANSGNEAVQKAVTLARAYTGRNKVAKFEGGFHGSNEYSYWSISCDESRMGCEERPVAVPQAAGMARRAGDDIVLLPFDEDAMVELIKENADDLAVVLLEPVLGAGGGLPVPRGLVARLREVTRDTGVLLLFDEVITGFRMALGGAQGWLGVTPDIALFGKAIGGGMPIGIVSSTARIVDRCLELDPDLAVAGTFSGNAMSMAASGAFLDLVMLHPGLYDELAARGDHLRVSFNSYAAERGMPFHMTGAGSMWQVHACAPPVERPRDLIREDPDLLLEFALRLRLQGVFVPAPLHISFLSTAHSDEDVEDVLAALRAAADGCCDKV